MTLININTAKLNALRFLFLPGNLLIIENGEYIVVEAEYNMFGVDIPAHYSEY